MRTAALIARVLLGIIFVVFGANGFLNFIPMPPPPALGMQFFGALIASHYYVLIFAVQFVGGVLLLINRYVPLALVLLAPVIVNIFFFHVLIAPSGVPMAVLLVILWTLVALKHRSSFDGILAAT